MTDRLYLRGADPQWAVPSHARQDRVNGLTLRLLADRGVPRDNVRLFVTPALLDGYRAAVDPGLVAEVIPGADGLAAQRNFIARWYPEGTPLVQPDDDLRDVRRRIDDKKTEPVPALDTLATIGFERCALERAGLWGIYPTLNPMFMRGGTRVGLWFCIGQLFGIVNTHAEWATITRASKEDYERTLLWWERFGAVVRIDSVAAKSPLYGPGGLQADDRPDRRGVNEADVAYLMARWPGRVKLAKRVGPVGPEVRLTAKGVDGSA